MQPNPRTDTQNALGLDPSGNTATPRGGGFERAAKAFVAGFNRAGGQRAGPVFHIDNQRRPALGL